jgi:curved DNA-binding protein
MEYKDYYAVLGVPRTASPAEIKKAFRKLAREHHPDSKPGDTSAEQRFKEVNEANAVLSDPDKRSLYDRLGADWESYARAGAAASGTRSGTGGADPFAGFGGFGAGAPGGNVRYEFRGSGAPGEFSDFFNVFFSGASEPLGGSMGSVGTPTGPGRSRRPAGGPTFEDILAGMGLDADGTVRPRRGGSGAGTPRGSAGRRPAAEAIAEITLDEAYRGTTRLIDIDGKRLEVTIPKGADTGSRIRLTGKAPGGGDVHVVVRQLPDPVFTRKGADLSRDLSLALGEALIGAEVPVATPKGRVLLTIPPGTQPGRTFRLTGQGMPKFKSSGSGDLNVRIKVVLPTDLTDAARSAAQTFIDAVDQPDPRQRTTRET